RHVVLALAGDDAGVAAGARGQVDAHAPLRALVVAGLFPQRPGLRDLDRLCREPRLAVPFGEGGLADDRAPVHGAVILGLGDAVVRAGRLERRPGGKAERGALAQRVDARADARADPARRGSPVAEVHDDRLVGLPGHDPHRQLDRRRARAVAQAKADAVLVL